MPEGYVQIPLSPDEPERYEKLAVLTRAMQDGERLSAYRRVLTAVLALLGAPLALVSYFDHSATRSAFVAVLLLWLGMGLAIIWLLWREYRNHRLTTKLLSEPGIRSGPTP